MLCGVKQIFQDMSVMWRRGPGSATSWSELTLDIILKQRAVPVAALGNRDGGSLASAPYPGKRAV